MNGFPRRSNLVFNTPSEIAIYEAMQEVEKLGADERLTKAVILLQEAKDEIAEYIDEKLAE